MSKKGKKVSALAEDIQAMIAVLPKLEAFIGVLKEIAVGYQKYRKNGGLAIPGIEKHVGGIKKENSAPSPKKKKSATAKETKAPKEGAAAIKTKMKVKT
jgi:hypothetical protein